LHEKIPVWFVFRFFETYYNALTDTCRLFAVQLNRSISRPL
jgi:hypothetical protein